MLCFFLSWGFFLEWSLISLLKSSGDSDSTWFLLFYSESLFKDNSLNLSFFGIASCIAIQRKENVAVTGSKMLLSLFGHIFCCTTIHSVIKQRSKCYFIHRLLLFWRGLFHWYCIDPRLDSFFISSFFLHLSTLIILYYLLFFRLYLNSNFI